MSKWGWWFTVKLCTKLLCKICIRPICWISFVHKSNDIRTWIISLPLPPHPRTFNSILKKPSLRYIKVIYHSEPIDGTLNTPQWMKIPILLSSYHAGNGRESNDVQSGVYCCSVIDTWQKQTAIMNILAKKESIFLSREDIGNWDWYTSNTHLYVKVCFYSERG